LIKRSSRDVKETGCYGAAKLARNTIEYVAVYHLFRPFINDIEIFSPNPDNSIIYNNKLESYKQLYHVLRLFWKV
jgi:hypothetical protein